MADYLTFTNILNAIQEVIKGTSSTKNTMIGYLINQVYLNEVMVCDDLYPLFWMRAIEEAWKAKVAATITDISKANPGIITAASHGFLTDDIVSLYNIVGMTQLNNKMFRVVYATDDTFSLKDLDGNAINTSSMTAYSSGGIANHRGLTLDTGVAAIHGHTQSFNIQRIISAEWHDEDYMEEKGDEFLKNWNPAYDENASRPKYYQFKKSYLAAGGETNQLLWFPCSDQAYTLRMWFEKRAPRLSGTNVPLLPHQFHDMIVSGVLTRLIEHNVQVENAVIWPGLYQRQLRDLQAFNRKFYEQQQIDLTTKKPYLL